MPQLGPHISVSDEQLVSRVFGLVDLEGYGQWPGDVRDLAAGLAAELFLVRYNPFVDPELVRESVKRRLSIARPTLSGEYPAILNAAVRHFWEQFDADMAFRKALHERLKAALPEECIGASANTLVECATDATDLRLELPLFVLFPETPEQVQAIVRLANEMGFALIPRGGGTGLTGGAIPMHARAVVLSLARFKKILDIDPDAKVLCAQAGVITLDAIKAAAEQDLLFTVDPASKAASSLGGNISENSGGPFAFEYGTTIDNILSYRMVLPTGGLIEVRRKDHPRHKIFETESAVFEIFDDHGALLESVTLAGDDIRGKGLGKDVSNKFLGGLPGVQKEGVDGVIVDACFVLHKKPAHSRVLCLEFYGRSMHNAMLVIKDIVGLRDTIRKQGDLVKISALEEWGPKYVQAIEYRKKSSTYEGDPISVLLVQLDSDHETALEQAVQALLAMAQPYDGVDIFAAQDEKEAEVFWEDRHKLSAIAKHTSGFKVNEDVVIPLEVIPEFSDFLENLNLIYLSRRYRKALLQVRELPGVAFDDPAVDAALDRALSILKKKTTTADLSEDELETEIRYVFQELRDKHPKHDREIEALYREIKARRIAIASHMHAGDGNCHVNIPVNSNDAEMLAQAHEAAKDVFEKVLSLQGEVSGEHGIGITKIAYLSEDKIKALRAYKAKVDPKNVLNPAKLTERKLPSEPYTFSFNRLIQDLDKTALKDKEQLIALLRNIQTCTRCGKCKQVCPMFQPQRGLLFHPRNKNISLGALMEAIYYSQVQRGEPDKGLLAELRRIMEHCTACGKCTAVCPIKIDSAGAALQMRSFLEYKGQGGHPIKTRVLTMLAKDPAGRLPKAAKVLSLGQTAANRVLGVLPGAALRGMASPVLQGQGPHIDFRNLYEELKLGQGSILKRPGAAPDDTVLYFPGCGAGLFSHSIGMATLFLLLKTGANVVLPDKHLCCGYPLLSAGCQEAYQANRHRTMMELLDLLVATGRAGLKAMTLITACGTCRESLETYEFHRELSEPPRRLDAMQFLLERLPGPFPAGEALLYHAACHPEWTSVSKVKAAEAYRQALSGILDAPVALSPHCCGESGLGALTSPAIYNRLRERKKEQLDKDLEAADRKRPVLVGCPSCKVGIKRCLLQMKRHNPVLHATEYLAQAVGGPRWKRSLKKMLESAERRGKTLLVE
jgi:FAD/FMN-containing dehydrogenase/Fe-S oxidoreductase